MEYKLRKLGSIKKIKLPEQKFVGRDMDAKKESKEKKKKKRKKRKLHIFRKLFVALIGIGLLCCFFGLGVVKGILDSTPPITSFATSMKK